MEWWNGFFSIILFACLRTNYCHEYRTLMQRSTIPRIGSRKYQNKNWLGWAGCLEIYIPATVAIAAVCQPSSLQMAAGNW